LRVPIYARYSTEDQHPTSIEDQVQFCMEFLKSNGITNVSIQEISDREMSGELVSRPGINHVRDGVADWSRLIGKDCGGWSDFHTRLDWLCWGLAVCNEEPRLSDDVNEKLYR
jgi:hypothetical protein